MRLLVRNQAGEFVLTQDFVGVPIPKYAILSHTWGADTEEVTFQDLMNVAGRHKSGYKKIKFCGEQAQRDGLQYFWVDTCCIDKTNSTELAEAINSMFRWYQNADRCYVYLSDVSINDRNQANSSPESWHLAFRKSRWFSRGWTLQELIAPRSCEFFCSHGKLLGDKKSLEEQIHERTGIALLALRGKTLSEFSVQERLSWAENRQTKREEDKAYSLLGIFDISLPLIYGEGGENAFRRLHDELYKRSRKRQLDELSPVLHDFTISKRSKTAHNQLSSNHSDCDPNVPGPGTQIGSAYSLHSDSSRNARKDTATGVSHSIDAITKQSLLDQLYFARIDERLTSLTAAQGSTCRWFLTTPEYTLWNDIAQHSDHGGFLWIKGNPGTGKSTLMKLLYEETKLSAKGDSSKITISFFFLARGTIEERSTTGLYRSLLHQLSEKGVSLRDSLEWMTTDSARIIQRKGWHEEALKQTLTHAVRRLGQRSLTIFIDALDECDDDQAKGMVFFLEDLCNQATQSQIRMQICFSSRHYPSVVIQKGIEVFLEKETGHTEDIKQYIESKLRLGKSKHAEPLRAEILQMSSGIFLWVFLVLDILNSEYPNSSISITKIRERLKKIPPKLSDLFEMILTRDDGNLEQLQICLKWILFATRPLKPQELYFAIQLGLDKESVTSWDRADIELYQMETFVTTCSKGLAETTKSKSSTVQFIHESVRDFLLGRYEAQWSGASSNFVGQSHELLRHCCLAQLTISLNDELDNPDPLPQAFKTVRLRKWVKNKFPFLEYSILNVLRHANNAQQAKIDQGDFLANFPRKHWVFLNNALENYDIRRYTSSVSVLYILAEKNLAELLQIHPMRHSCFEIEHERYGLPIFAAMATGSYEAVQTILKSQAEFHQQAPSLRRLCEKYFENENERKDLGRDFCFSQEKGVSSYVGKRSDDVIILFLVSLGKLEVESRYIHNQTLLSWAAENGREAIIRVLLEKGANIESKDEDGRTPLSCAAKDGQLDVVSLLLEKGANIESEDKDSQTPLSWAIQNRRRAIVKVLLKKGANIESKDTYGQTPLSWAAENGRKAMVKVLLKNGANIESKDKDSRTPLSWAIVNRREAIVKVLLKNGANIESKDKDGRTPLSRAATSWGGVTINLLLNWGADIESKDNNGRTPLSWAADCWDITNSKLLLKKGANIKSKDNNGQTPLSWAIKNRQWAVAVQLRKKSTQVQRL